MQAFTVFCTNKGTLDRTVWISTMEAETKEQACEYGLMLCAHEWHEEASNIAVLGVAVGSVEILDWSDDGLDVEVMARVRVEVDAFPGCGFNGSRFFDIELGEETDEPEGRELAGEIDELEELLAEVDVSDDPSGSLILQVRKEVRRLFDEPGRCIRLMTLAAGRDEEIFDLHVSVVAVWEVPE